MDRSGRNELMRAALAYRARGWYPIPLHHPIWPDGQQVFCSCHRGGSCSDIGKHPLHRSWTDQRLSAADIGLMWTEHPNANIGLLTGEPSGFFVVDVDLKGMATWGDLCEEHSLVDDDNHLVVTGSGGVHWYFIMPDFPVSNSAGQLPPGIDIRGTGGQVVAPPSVTGRGHYAELDQGLVQSAPDWLLSLIRPQTLQPAQTPSVSSTSKVSQTPRISDPFEKERVEHYAARALDHLIAGYRDAEPGRGSAAMAYAMRAGLELADADWNSLTEDKVRAELDTARILRLNERRSGGGGQSHDEFDRSWRSALRNHGAPRAYPSGGGGEIEIPFGLRPVTDRAPVDSSVVGSTVHATTTKDAPIQPVIEEAVSSWVPEDLTGYLNGSYVPEVPSLFPRDDGVCLLYRGRVHSFHGESESGKSFLLHIESARILRSGGRVVLIDFESDAATVVPRLLALGCTPAQVKEGLSYLRPEVRPTTSEADSLAYAGLLAGAYDLIGVDGVTESMGVFGVKDSANNDEVSTWVRWFPRRLARSTGAAVVLVDHVTKDPDRRGRFALGAQAKMAAIDGAAYTIEVAKALGRGLRGAIRARVAKDRPGAVRPACGPYRALDRTQEACYVLVDSKVVGEGPSEVNMILTSIRPPGTDRERLDRMCGQVARFLAGQPPLSQRAIERGVHGRAAVIREAIGTLYSLGFVRISGSGRQGSPFLHELVKVYDPRDFAWIEGDDEYEPEPAEDADLTEVS